MDHVTQSQGPSAPDLDSLSARRLLARARRLLWLTIVPPVLLVLLLGARQQWLRMERELDTAATSLSTQALVLDSLALDVERYVEDLRRLTRRTLAGWSADAPSQGVAAGLAHRSTPSGLPDGETLDALPQLLRQGMAQVLWPQDSDPEARRLALLHAQALSAALEAEHDRTPNLAWSYFLGWPDRHLVLYPWIPSNTFVRDRQATTLQDALSRLYDDQPMSLVRPQDNPSGQPRWSAWRTDPHGKGVVVSFAAPIFVNEAFRGAVAADLRMSVLSGHLDRLAGAPWRAWLIDDQGKVLIARCAPSDPQAWSGALPPAIAPEAVSRALASPGVAAAADDWQVFAVPTKEAPWRLVLAAPRRALWLALLPDTAPYLLIIVALLGTGVLAQALLARRLLLPMLALLGYLERLRRDPDEPAPNLGPGWQSWIAVLSNTFTAMRAAGQAQMRAEAIKSALVDHAQVAVIVADTSERIVEFNPAAEAMFCHRREAAIGQPLARLFTLPALPSEPPAESGQRQEGVGHRADGSDFPIEVVLWTTSVGSAHYLTASITDLTQTHAAADEIERQREQLRRTEKLTAMGSLLASVAHELNNPLAIVVGRAGLLEERLRGTDAGKDAVRIRDAAERCGRVVRTFLNMARGRPVDHATVQLNEVVKSVADMLAYTLRSHGVELELHLDPSLPDIQGDSDQLGQVVLNLLVNAQHAVEGMPGRPCVSVTTVREHGQVRVSVADNGVGVSAALRDRIFDPFYTTKTPDQGTGLGLSVSRAIARAHGGELSLAPAGEGGTRFDMILPHTALLPPADAARPTSALHP